jgi:glycosyltransferase involved in cell wall biosynthesis
MNKSLGVWAQAVPPRHAMPPEPAIRKRVLLIAYHYPPSPLAGALRPSFLARYLPLFGWEATVLTKSRADPVEAAVAVETARDVFERFTRPRAGGARPPAPLVRSRPDNQLINRLKALAKSLLLFPDRAAGWIPGACARALEITRRQHFDAIISTSPPVSAHIVAGITALRRGLPWIADYRDLWNGNPYDPKSATRERIELSIERALRGRASAITAVSRDLIDRQNRRFGTTFGETIPAAFDPAEWETIGDPTPTDFRLCYAGLLYDGRRRFDVLLSAIKQLRSEDDRAGLAARIDYYGPDEALVNQLLADLDLRDVVTCHGFVERQLVLPALRRSAVLLVLLDMDPHTISELGSKIFECVGARRHVIAIGPPGSAVQTLIEQHHLGWFASDVHSTATALRAAHQAFTAGRIAPPSGDLTNDITTAQEVARRFARLLDRVRNRGGALELYVQS